MVSSKQFAVLLQALPHLKASSAARTAAPAEQRSGGPAASVAAAAGTPVEEINGSVRSGSAVAVR